MRLRLKPWGWVLVALALLLYLVWGTWSVYGGFYLGWPPYTPALLNGTRQPISRVLTPARRSVLRVRGEAREGRILVEIDGREAASLGGRFNRIFPLTPGRHELRLVNRESTGWVNYGLE